MGAVSKLALQLFGFNFSKRSLFFFLNYKTAKEADGTCRYYGGSIGSHVILNWERWEITG